MRPLALALVVFAGAAPALAADPVVLQGQVPAGVDFIELPFEVPAGTAELNIAHDSLEPDSILDWGLIGPDGFRGYGGGNREPITTAVRASSRSYHTGPLTPGTWRLYVGKAKSASGTPGYKVTVTARTAATLADEPQRSAFTAPSALRTGARWYAGDFHAHSRESGDADAPIDVMAQWAKAHGLDFVELSDHNTSSQLELMRDAQSRSPDVLLIPGVEVTTYGGHANGIGATTWVDHRVGFDSVTLENIAAQVVAQGAVFSINHPMFDLGDACIGCRWRHPLPKASLGGVEIQTSGWDSTGVLFSSQTLAFWDHALDEGLHLAALGGSDDHSGGRSDGSPIGNPTTMVFATELSVSALVEAVRAGHTVVKLQGELDPMVELHAGDAIVGDTVEASAIDVTATVTGGKGMKVRWVVDGAAEAPLDVDLDPFEAKRTVNAGSRVRAEAMVDGHPETVTSHIWVVAPSAPPMHGCNSAPVWPCFALAMLVLLRRARPHGR